MREELIALIEAADRDRDIHKSHELYTQVLGTELLETHLSLREIANVYYNRSLNHTRLYQHFISSERKESQPTRALTHMEEAIADMERAMSGYTSEVDIDACRNCLDEYQSKLTFAMNALENRAAVIPPLQSGLFQAQLQDQAGAASLPSTSRDPHH
ncbi:hypothetical protein PsalN5692_03625 (plasmid) [Piscirickettsia salmonis]|uniref:hypothetical protein n=2 Tax=Piscirickettsia salmonis TaxID=1238 RepID=UPI0012B996D9|nr:hypothetical protein [Piscirickettsia salmonis]QGP52117.1 hypothetical protein PsalN5692_03625 [Piscirickettsia salmonis]